MAHLSVRVARVVHRQVAILGYTYIIYAIFGSRMHALCVAHVGNIRSSCQYTQPRARCVKDFVEH